MQPPRIAPGDAANVVHIGRQPVYDAGSHVVGYELLFRDVPGAMEASRRNAYATSRVIVNAFTEFGIRELVGDRICFINLTQDFLTGALQIPFEPGQAVLEVLETVEVTDEVLAGVADLVDQGYPIALDDFVWGMGHERLLGLASYVKLDMLETDPAQVREAVGRCRQYPGLCLVAERLETDEHVALAKGMGFDLFQGYALGRPQVVTMVSLSPSRLRRIELLGALTDDAAIDRIVTIVTSDPALSFRVLRATNSAAAGLPRRVSSVHGAVMMLGTVRIRQWVALMLVSDIAEASEEQLAAAMTRARLCQTLGERLDISGESAFTVGLLAGVAELISEPVAELAKRMPLTDEVHDALVHHKGRLGEVLAMVQAYEASDLAALQGAPVSSTELAYAYLAAVGWSMRTISGVIGAAAS